CFSQSPGLNPDSLLLTLHKHASDKKDSCIHLGKKRGSTRASGSKSSSCFMDMKCPGCSKFSAAFSRAQPSIGSVLLCCTSLLVESCSVRQKQHYLNKAGCVRR
uniref:Uncharacterized protein n=1 Tax=Strix occidentalis caurina TaxID=311401 RepID=A0A8D0FUW0_STROC